MQDIEILLPNTVGALATMAEILGQNNVNLEGGGVFAQGDRVVAHFLVHDAQHAKMVLAAAGITVLSINEVLIQRLRQDLPGQLGAFYRLLADAGVNIVVQYSDHANQLILVVDNMTEGGNVSQQWMNDYFQ